MPTSWSGPPGGRRGGRGGAEAPPPRSPVIAGHLAAGLGVQGQEGARGDVGLDEADGASPMRNWAPPLWKLKISLPLLQLMKMTEMIGVLFFPGGFFSGQASVALL